MTGKKNGNVPGLKPKEWWASSRGLKPAATPKLPLGGG
jgi:hypothetical protein